MKTKFHNKKTPNYIAVIGVEKSLIKKHYNFLKCVQQGENLCCYGQYQPTHFSEIYKYRIIYIPPNRPKVTLVKPKIDYHNDIHMFPKDKSLCLYHESDLKWNLKYHLYDTIIPWTHEWFIYYELYLISGKWEHPFVPHTTNKDY